LGGEKKEMVVSRKGVKKEPACDRLDGGRKSKRGRGGEEGMSAVSGVFRGKKGKIPPVINTSRGEWGEDLREKKRGRTKSRNPIREEKKKRSPAVPAENIVMVTKKKGKERGTVIMFD